MATMVLLIDEMARDGLCAHWKRWNKTTVKKTRNENANKRPFRPTNHREEAQKKRVKSVTRSKLQQKPHTTTMKYRTVERTASTGLAAQSQRRHCGAQYGLASAQRMAREDDCALRATLRHRLFEQRVDLRRCDVTKTVSGGKPTQKTLVGVRAMCRFGRWPKSRYARARQRARQAAA